MTMFSETKFKRTPALWTAWVVVMLAALPALAAGPEDLGAWSVEVQRTGEWVKGPDLPAESEVACHFYGMGKFRASFRQGEAVQKYTVDLTIEDWFAFKRTLKGGPVEIRVESVEDARYPKPVFKGLIATLNPQFVPNLDDFTHPLYLVARNLGAADARVELTAASGRPPSYFVYLHYLSADGFSPTGVLKAKEKSSALNVSRTIYGRTTLTFKPGPGETDVEVRLFADRGMTKELKVLHLLGNPAPSVSLVLYPGKEEPFTVSTIDEILDRNRKAVETALANDPRPVPKRARVMTSISDSGEDMRTFEKEVALARLVGANGGPSLGRLEAKRAELGFRYYWTMNFIPWPTDWNFDVHAADQYIASTSANSPRGEPTVIVLMDEPAYVEISKNPALDKRFVAWLQKKGLTPADAGVARWEEVKCIAPTPSEPRLSALSYDFQNAEETRYWDDYALAFKKFNPDLQPVVNFNAGNYYDGSLLNLWELYRRPGMDLIWAEDWHGYSPVGTGIIAWYADLMRSQAKYRNMPMGTYPILGYGYSASLDAMRYYERFMRGCYIFETYPYSPRGIEPSWLDQPQVTVNMARRHRDLAQVEDILCDGQVLPAKAALVYPNSAQLWNMDLTWDACGFYLANLHAGIELDIVTEQDLVDGLAKDYQVLVCFGPYIRKDALGALQAFAQAGGTVACVGAPNVDPARQPIPAGNAFVSVKSAERTASDSPSRFAYEFPGFKPLDTVKWNGNEIPAFCRKWKLETDGGAKVLATFSDGGPAIIQSAAGSGKVICYAFSPGLSYMHADYGDNGGYATVLCGKTVERKCCVLPTSNAAKIVSVDAEMVSHRVVASKDAAMVGLVDYGLGEIGRGTKNPRQWTVDFETMKPFPVTVTIACKAKPESVVGVRCGAVKWEYAAGQLKVEVPLRGVDMLVLKGRGLF